MNEHPTLTIKILIIVSSMGTQGSENSGKSRKINEKIENQLFFENYNSYAPEHAKNGFPMFF